MIDTSPISAPAILDALFANSTIGLVVWDRELRFRRVNARLAAMNGLAAEAHVGHRPREVLPELGERLEALLGRVVATGEPLRDVEVSGETPAAVGVQRHWLASYFPIRTDANEIAGVTGLVVEITAERDARDRAESAMQRTAFVDAELQALYAALPVGVAFLSPDLRYQRVNETLARLNGRPVGAHVGASLEDVVGKHAPALRTELERVVANREPVDLELEVALPHDPTDLRALEATFFPVVDRDEALLGVGGVIRDVTVRRELERKQSDLLRDALFARAAAEAAGVRTDDAREEAERTSVAAERGRARIALLARAGQQMAESMEWEPTLQAVVRAVVPDVADWASLTVVDPRGALRVHAIAHRDPERERLAWELAERYPASADAPSGPGHVVRTGELEIRTDITPDAIRAAARDREHLRLMENLSVKHVVEAPLTGPSGVLGVLSFVLGDSGRRFEPEDLQLIRSLATRATLHIENARLYTERSTIAETLQASLLPRALPEIPGVELAAHFQPAGDQNTVGGDFYDVFGAGENAWAAVVGDVSGKGAPAAALTALARYTLRATARTHPDPAANLALLNAAFKDDTGAEQFCTVLYARVCPGPDGLDVRFANGGHLPPLLLKPDGSVTSVDGGRGPLVGALADARYEEAALTLRPGELLLLYTDGVTEVSTTDITLGERELHATLAGLVGASVQEVVAAAANRAVELQAHAPRDDIALLALRLKPATVHP
ncbi:SpoIIE family protein phosphatase [Solirubrobacter phytolaccae]|uniref:SpoIIE family protein phosphatase n=1 Tax=Solirubrobacter phytolaccae TaxID=1404360 RepID=A0A9X3SI87_9ACTN|nr:SpoIIE family protein phosphatase [Solirubrobacter phytolaccae]MDA0184022.1 SpoIIE family protein phosphatase [Solirubrobacter phytolaccae]